VPNLKKDSVFDSQEPTFSDGKANSYTPEHTGKIVTVEKTSKDLKMQRMMYFVLGVFGTFMAIAFSAGVGIFFLVIALVWGGVVEFLIWWRHG